VYDPDAELQRKAMARSTAFDPTEKPTMLGVASSLLGSGGGGTGGGGDSGGGGGGPRVSGVLEVALEPGSAPVRLYGALYGNR
jgi:hypothetical protein